MPCPGPRGWDGDGVGFRGWAGSRGGMGGNGRGSAPASSGAACAGASAAMGGSTVSAEGVDAVGGSVGGAGAMLSAGGSEESAGGGVSSRVEGAEDAAEGAASGNGLAVSNSISTPRSSGALGTSLSRPKTNKNTEITATCTSSDANAQAPLLPAPERSRPATAKESARAGKSGSPAACPPGTRAVPVETACPASSGRTPSAPPSRSRTPHRT